MAKYIILFANLFIVLVVSALGSLPALFWGLKWNNYLAIFFMLIAIQLFVGKLWTMWIESKIETTLADVKSRQELVDAIQTIEASCAYCSTNNSIDIMLNKENRFTCNACNQINHVSIAISTSRTTSDVSTKSVATEIFRKLGDQ